MATSRILVADDDEAVFSGQHAHLPGERQIAGPQWRDPSRERVRRDVYRKGLPGFGPTTSGRAGKPPRDPKSGRPRTNQRARNATRRLLTDAACASTASPPCTA